MAKTYNSRIKIEMRKRQIIYQGDNVVVQCNPDGSASYVPGVIPDNEFVDYTGVTKGLEKFGLEWSETTSGNADGGETNEAGSNYDKGITVDLTFYKQAYYFIYDWLVLNPCGILNAIEVRITDLLCEKQYRLFELKADNLGYKPIDEPCEFTIKLREQDLVWHCVHKNVIYDNWQHWFENGSDKQHPCFLTAVEPRPRLLASARLGLLIFAISIPVVPGFLTPGSDDTCRRILGLDNFVPSPLVRDYLANVCGKCGLTMDTLFDDLEANDYRNLCIFYPLAGKDFWHQNDEADVQSPATWFNYENRWLITLADFLDKLKTVFKAEWYVTPNNKLIFHSKIEFTQAAAIIDYTADGSPAIYKLEYTFSGTKKPAYGRYQYQGDGADMASQEISTLYNDIADYDGPANNPMLEGKSTNYFDFAPTGFVRDGRADDYTRTLVNDAETAGYILVALITIIVIALVGGTSSAPAGAILGASVAIWVARIASKANAWRSLFGQWDSVYTGAVRITTDQVSTPRLLLWDGESLTRAKVVRQDPPEPNPTYNPDLIPYEPRNTISNNTIFNYPMYFDSFFLGNMFDRFHSKVDNPLLSLETHQSFSFRLDLCCEVMDLYGLWDGDFAKIGYVIKIEQRENHAIFGRIGNISIDYDTESVIIKGKVLKRLN